MSEIVVGVDGSQSARRALEWAIEEASRRGAALRAVYAYPVTRVHWGGRPLADAEVRERARAMIDREVAAAVEAATPSAFGPLRVTTEVVPAREHDVADVLLAFAKNADLLVLGSRGLGEIEGLVGNSVSTHCALHAPCSVVVIPPPRRVLIEEPAVSAAST